MNIHERHVKMLSKFERKKVFIEAICTAGHPSAFVLIHQYLAMQNKIYDIINLFKIITRTKKTLDAMNPNHVFDCNVLCNKWLHWNDCLHKKRRKIQMGWINGFHKSIHFR